MNTIEELKQAWLNKEVTIMELAWKVKKVAAELDQLYPYDSPPLVKFYVYVNGGDHAIAWCPKSGKQRTFRNMYEGFRPFCGNQGSCICNRENIAAASQKRTQADRDEIVRKRRETSRKIYGVDYAPQASHIKEKTAATCMERYGAKAPTLNPSVLAKSSATVKKNYGVDWPQQNPDIVARTTRVFFEKYGVEHPGQIPEGKEKQKATNLEKYGVEHPCVLPEILEASIELRRKVGYQTAMKNIKNVTPLFSEEDYMKKGRTHEFPWKCNSCDGEFTQPITDRFDIRCFACRPYRESWGETWIKNWLASNNITYTQWDRSVISPKELDFFLPDLKIAIEFNGIFFHSEERLERTYHQSKWRDCDTRGIKLLQIWEHELLYHPEIVTNRLANACGLITDKLGARKCSIRQLSTAEANNFFATTHLQGVRPSKNTWGLIDRNGQIVAAAAFGKTRYGKLSEWELLRYSNIGGTNVQGGLSKLIDHARKELGFSKLVSYANLNWGRGEVYGKLGFKLVRIAEPNYYYFRSINKDIEIKSRIAFQKHKIVGLAEGNTESEIARNMGYLRFYDAGNAVWLREW